ncbi:MAG: SMP-30/gluconolactonase/LRE family protein [Litorilinea sp.]
MKLELIADYACVTGEGPLWHPAEERLYWADIPQGRMFRYDPKRGEHEQFYSGDVVGGFTIQDDGALLLFMARGAVKILRDGQLTTILEEIDGEQDSRFNDVFADVGGRVFCGTMPAGDRLGTLYRLDPDRTLTRVVEEVNISNGMGLTPDRTGLYYSVSLDKKIYYFDYDQATGELSNRRVFVDLSDEPGIPDGMTVDAEGYVWSARWDGWCLMRYAPDGTEAMCVDMPTKKISSVIFGGPDYKDMYITTAGGHDRAENGDTAGALYRLRLGIQGVPEYHSQIR